MEKILCPVDFSESSKTAAFWAAKIAAKKNWELILFHKYLISDAEKEIKSTKGSVIEAASVAATQKLQALRDTLTETVKDSEKCISCGIKVEYGIELEEMIRKEAEASKVSLIVMGTEGAESFSDIIFGSKTSNIINHTHIPVLVVPEGATRDVPDTIIYATDLKNEDEKSMKLLFHFSKDLFHRIIILHSLEEDKFDKPGSLQEKFKPIMPENHGFEIEYTQLFTDNLFQGIQEFASAQNHSLIAIGKHPKSFFDFLSKGSFTRLMSLYSFIPTLIFRKEK